MPRVQLPYSFSYPSSGNLDPVVGTSVTVSHRDPTTGSPSTPATVYQQETGSTTYTSLATDSGGNVPGWVDPGSYVIVAAAQGSFSGATIAFEAVRGDGVTLVAPAAVDLSQLTTAIQNALVPTGTILDHAGTSAPSGFVLADGSVYATGSSGSTYYALSQVCGTRWNTGGEGTGNFRVPDLRGLVAVGAGSGSGLTARTVGPRLSGVSGGEESHALSSGENATHSHSIDTQGSHSHGGATGTESATHVHGPPGGTSFWADGGGVSNLEVPIASGGTALRPSFTGTQSSSHTHGIGVDGAHSHNLGNSGSGTAHNNMQPFAVVSKIIKL